MGLKHIKKKKKATQNKHVNAETKPKKKKKTEKTKKLGFLGNGIVHARRSMYAKSSLRA